MKSTTVAFPVEGRRYKDSWLDYPVVFVSRGALFNNLCE